MNQQTLNTLQTLMPNAVPAQHYMGDFDKAQMHITSSFDQKDAKGLTTTLAVLERYGKNAVAVHLMPTGFGGYSLEVLFDDEAGHDPIVMWNALISRRPPKRAA
ncbi:hypothetical protein [Methylobacterium radiodurans]|uniref:Uncharacterized protein n=1 Tax=Methylobacterium radiodurans TaxID=2202828 RepID=A0A2U8VP13_9HYPH|nr:hypothetical protein [Methylobacterium radiodurans]AWN35429.1 hypothetical protein DK427_06550 [Methylobacterium radiodurans]